MGNLPQVCVFLTFLMATVHKTDAGCPSKEWTQYKHEKCIRVLDLMMSNHSDAELVCQEQRSTLLSITSIEEQEFIRHLIFSDLGTFDNVWLGAVRVNSTTFRWTDGSPWIFDNWKEGSPSEVLDNGCLQMVPEGTFDPTISPSGLWSDVACGRRNLVVCQRRPTLSVEELTDLVFLHRLTSDAPHEEQEVKRMEAERQVKELEVKVSNLQGVLDTTLTDLTAARGIIEHVSSDFEELQKNPVPLGFVYTQLAGQPDPSVIWPTVVWTQVTQDYAGLFFRAEGGNSSGFGVVQNDQSPRLSRVMTKENTFDAWLPKDVDVPERGVSEYVYVGANNVGSGAALKIFQTFASFHNSGGEVRPTNQAIRLWKRTA